MLRRALGETTSGVAWALENDPRNGCSASSGSADARELNGEPERGAAGEDPVRGDLLREQQGGARRGDPDRPAVDHRRLSELPGGDGHEREGARVDAVEKGAGAR